MSLINDLSVMENIMKKNVTLMFALICAACSSEQETGFMVGNSERQMEGSANANVLSVIANRETSAVESSDDAADDPAIWINYRNPEKSLIIGTDKQAGLYVYDLNGNVVDFQALGKENNVDLRQNLKGDIFGGNDTLIAASNRTKNAVDILTIEQSGTLKFLGSYPSEVEPYGLCVGLPNDNNVFRVLVNYKSGLVELTDVTFSNGELVTQKFTELMLPGQLEGCVFDDQAQEFFVGEEEGGIWRFPMQTPTGKGEMQAKIGMETGLVADVEGIDIYHAKNRKILVASSQGDYTYAAFEILPDALKPLKKFRIADNTIDGVDGVQETDGLAVTNVSLNGDFPKGILVVQDGENEGGFQNFKIIDWRKISELIDE